MATLYVDKDAVGANNGSSWADAWTTIDAAMNDVATRGPGPHTYLVKGPKTYSEIVTIDTAGAPGAEIIFQGDDGSGNSAQITIEGGSVRANGIASALGATGAYYVFKNFTVQNTTGTGFAIGNSTDLVTFKDCNASTCGGYGFQGDNSICFERCSATGNTSGGFDADTPVFVVACRASSNGGYGITANNGLAFGCECFSNSTGGIKFSNAGTFAVVNCTVDGDAKDTNEGINFSNVSITQWCAVNNLIYDCVTGLLSGRDIGEMVISCNNLMNANTTDYSNANTFSGEISGAPTFVDEAGGDLRLQPSSPAVEAGVDVGETVNSIGYMDIGAHQLQSPPSVIIGG